VEEGSLNLRNRKMRSHAALLLLLATQGVPSLAAPAGMLHPAHAEAARRQGGTPLSALTDQERDAMCTPIHDFSEAETSAWLSGHGYNATAFAGVDGEALMYWAEHESGFLLNNFGVPFAKIPRLVNLVKAARQPPHLHLPPSMDPCSVFYLARGGQGTTLYLTPLIETVLELDQNAYTFTAIFQLLFMWHDDRTKYIPVGTQAELEECKIPCSTIPGYFETCPSDANCAPQTDGVPANKCCDMLWTPIRDISHQAVIFPNAVDIEVLSTTGPSFLLEGVPVEPVEEGVTAAFAYITQRIKGTFNIPLSFREYPHDVQTLDIYLVFPEAYQQTRLAVADGIYSMGGDYLPAEERDKFLEGGYEEISGWTIEEKVTVVAHPPGNEYKLWLNEGRVPKFRAHEIAMETFIQGMGFLDMAIPKFFELISQDAYENFATIRLTLKRNPQYYEQNIVIPVVLLNCLNFLALMLGPDAIEARLASCATVILALMTFQIVVTDQLPRAGYPMGAATFLIVSNIYMISTGIESVIIYYMHNNKVSPFDPLGRHPHNPERLRLELRVCDIIFVLIYIASYLPLLVDLARPTDIAAFVVPFTVVAIICLFAVKSLFTKRQKLNSNLHPSDTVDSGKAGESGAQSDELGVVGT